jgi:hypothetical protein
MTPVDMSEIWSPDNPTATGDCFKACIASIFDLKIGAVPHFVKIDELVHYSWAYSLDQWLAPQGLWYCDFPATVKTYSVWVPVDGMYAIGSGISPRKPEWKHSVVVKLHRFEPLSIVHDPHPSRLGVAGEITLIGMFMSRKPIVKSEK